MRTKLNYERMPTAAVSGAVLALALELHTNSLCKRPFGVTRCVVKMGAGALVARMIVKWDKKAQQRKQIKQEILDRLKTKNLE